MVETVMALMMALAGMQVDAMPPAWVPCALVAAADESHGDSFDNLHGDPDFICTSFAYHMLEEGGLDLDAVSDGDADPSTGLSSQMRALEALGFTKIDKVDFATLPAGSVVYACTKGGAPKHVEIYIGTFDLASADGCGNPPFAAEGTPLTCGARITDRDPAPGDQLQGEPGRWYGGEVGAFAWDSRGEDYWSVAYAPPKDEKGADDGR